MKKIDKKTLLITSIITLLPVVVGLLLWDKLPDTIPTHFGMDGTPNGWSSKPFTVFGLPVLMLFFHLLCLGITSVDPKYDNINDKVFAIVVWICPVISLLVVVASYGSALGWEMNISKYTMFGCGVLFMVIGNYLPKCKQSYTLGIKLPWTLDDEENWNRTHRMAGKLWVAGGIVILLNVFLGISGVEILVLILMVVIPTVYSWAFSRKKDKEKMEE